MTLRLFMSGFILLVALALLSFACDGDDSDNLPAGQDSKTLYVEVEACWRDASNSVEEKACLPYSEVLARRAYEMGFEAGFEAAGWRVFWELKECEEEPDSLQCELFFECVFARPWWWEAGRDWSPGKCFRYPET